MKTYAAFIQSEIDKGHLDLRGVQRKLHWHRVRLDYYTRSRRHYNPPLNVTNDKRYYDELAAEQRVLKRAYKNLQRRTILAQSKPV